MQSHQPHLSTISHKSQQGLCRNCHCNHNLKPYMITETPKKPRCPLPPSSQHNQTRFIISHSHNSKKINKMKDNCKRKKNTSKWTFTTRQRIFVGSFSKGILWFSSWFVEASNYTTTTTINNNNKLKKKIKIQVLLAVSRTNLSKQKQNYFFITTHNN